MTSGTKWDDWLYKSQPEHGKLLKYLNNFEFDRNSETHISKNIVLYSKSLRELNLKFSIGIQMDSEITQQEQSRIEPKLNFLGDFNFIYAHKHVF